MILTGLPGVIVSRARRSAWPGRAGSGLLGGCLSPWGGSPWFGGTPPKGTWGHSWAPGLLAMVSVLRRVCGQPWGAPGGQASRLGWVGAGAWQTQSPLAANLTRQRSVCISQARLPDFIKVALGLNFKAWPRLQRQLAGQGSDSPGVPLHHIPCPEASVCGEGHLLPPEHEGDGGEGATRGTTGPAGDQRRGLRWSAVSLQTQCPQRAAGLRGERLGTPCLWTQGGLPCREAAPEGSALSLQSGGH